MKKYVLKNIDSKEIVIMTLPQIIENINRDRSDEWQNYDKTDWKEGLEEFTEFELVREIKEVRVHFFYRDGANYKCHFTKVLDKQLIDDLELDVENDIDTKYRSDVLFEIEDFGLKVFDIPLIAEYGFDPEYDHNYVSITKIEEVDS